jgi:integrase
MKKQVRNFRPWPENQKRLELVPRIFTVAEARTALEFVRATTPRLLPWFVLGLFAGIRPEEADRLDWAAVDLERGLVRVDAAASKVRQRRVVPLAPAAVAWLKLGGDLPLPLTSRRRYVRRLRDRLGWAAWPQDVLRHTAASFLLAEHQDAAKVALWLGNSPKILLTHYHEMVSDAEKVAFWGLKPF